MNRVFSAEITISSDSVDGKTRSELAKALVSRIRSF